MTCVDLRTVGRFRILNELTGEKAGKRDDPWELLIEGRRGSVSPYGGSELLASTNHSRTSAKLLAAVPEAVVTQDGDDGQNIRFPAGKLEVVAAILGLKRRRVLSDANRARLVNAGANTHFQRAESTISGQDGVSVA